MIELIYAVQNHLAAEGTSIDNVMALFCALVAIVFIGYLVEAKK